MVELSSICGLPIYLDEETGEITYGEEVVCSESRQVVLADLIPVLLNKYLRYPEQIYKCFKNVVLSNDTAYLDSELSYNLYKIPHGLLGVEYIKTHIYYSEPVPGKYSCVVEIISGELTVIVQKNSEDQEEYAMNTAVDEVHIITLEKGDRLAIPTGYLYTFVNAGAAHVVFAIVTGHEHTEVDYANLQREKGLAYYIISKNAKIEIVPNPRYKVERDLVCTYWRDLDEDIKARYNLAQGNSLAVPLYSFFKEQKKVLAKVLS